MLVSLHQIQYRIYDPFASPIPPPHRLSESQPALASDHQNPKAGFIPVHGLAMVKQCTPAATASGTDAHGHETKHNLSISPRRTRGTASDPKRPLVPRLQSMGASSTRFVRQRARAVGLAMPCPALRRDVVSGILELKAITIATFRNGEVSMSLGSHCESFYALQSLLMASCWRKRRWPVLCTN